MTEESNNKEETTHEKLVKEYLRYYDANIKFKAGTVLEHIDQAEDGIRDLVRSRGLGDVYKRQLFMSCFFFVI